jgi:RNA polymerase sigma factor (sigma-70 family)
MPPPPAQPLATRIVLGPALRTQSDRRLVKLVREGYETAFEEIVRRYRGPLDRFAAAIVGGRSEDVTQDAFSKALLALRGSENEIELRPWLYRIVRNTALNDLRDRPPTTAELDEELTGTESAAATAERREEIAELVTRLQALPEPQRAAIVMRELEGLSHEEIAAALGVSGGAARQAIHRARLRLRDAVGLLVPLPLLRVLFDHGAEAAAGAGGVAAAAGASAAGGGAALGGLGIGGAAKVGMATVLVAGSVGAGVALQRDRDERGSDAAATTPLVEGSGGGTSGSSGPGGGSSGSSGPGSGTSGSAGEDDRSGPNRGDDDDGRGDGRGDDRGDDDGRGRGRSGEGDRDDERSENSGRRSGSSDSGSGSSGSGRSGGGDEIEVDDRSGKGSSGGSGSRSGSSGSGSSGDDGDGESDSGSGGGEEPDDDSSSGSGSGSGSGESVTSTSAEPAPEAEEDDGDSSGSGSDGSDDESDSGDDSGGED